MIVCSFNPIKLNTVVERIYERTKGEEITALFYVRREATFAEWLEYRRINNIPFPYENKGEPIYCYEVSTD